MKALALEIGNVDKMASEQASEFRELFTARIPRDDGAAAREHLMAGRPIYYCEDATPEGVSIKEFPDGRRQLVRFDAEGEHVVRTIA
jgi:hypothetical protein